MLKRALTVVKITLDGSFNNLNAMCFNYGYGLVFKKSFKVRIMMADTAFPGIVFADKKESYPIFSGKYCIVVEQYTTDGKYLVLT